MNRKTAFLIPFLTLLLLLGGLALIAGTAPSATAQVTNGADLRILKFTSPTNEVQAGEQFTYTIIVDNLGPISATNVIITDTLITSAAVDANGCSIAIRTEGWALDEFSCNFALSTGVFDLGTFGSNHLHPRSPGDMGRIIITINATADGNVDMTNIATVASETPDPDLSNNVAVTTLSVTDTADLATSQTASAILVNAGESITWTVTITNKGPSGADNVVVSDNLPVAIVDGSVTASGATCTLGTPGDPLDPLTCNLGNMEAGSSTALTLSGRVDPAFLAAQSDPNGAFFINNDVRVASDTFDRNTGDNLASASVEVTDEADLTLSTFALGAVRAGESFSYEYDISNWGPSLARDVTLRDFLPSEVEFLDAFVDVEGGTGITPLPCTTTAGSNTLLCPLGDLILTDGMPVLAVANVRIDPDTMHGTTINNNADVLLADTLDPNPANNSGSASVMVISEADLQIEKTVSDATPLAGEELSYEITVTNHGPATAWNVTVTDTLPTQATYLLDSLGCGPGLAGCALGDLAPGASRTFQILVELNAAAPPGATLTNIAEAGSATLDPDGTNNVATADVRVNTNADLRLLHFGNPAGEVEAGEWLTYTLFVDNFGPSVGHSVVVTDAFRSDGSFSIANIVNDPERPDNCNVTEQTGGYDVTCVLSADLEPLSATASGRWEVQVVVTADEAQSINATGHVTGADSDPNVEDNTATAVHTITDVADLVLGETAAGQVQIDGQPGGTFTTTAGEVTAGALVTYTLTVTNDGPSRATNAILWDNLSAGLTVKGIDTSQGSCTAGQTITCGLGALPAGATAAVTITAETAGWLPAETILQNEVWISSDVFDDNNGNDRGTTALLVTRAADLWIEKTQQPEAVLEGEIAYTIIAGNDGPSDALYAVISDTLPAHIDAATWQCVALDGARCPNGGAGDLLMTAHLPAGSWVMATIRGQLIRPTPVSNMATITPETGLTDPYPLNSQMTVRNAISLLYLPVSMSE